MSRVAARARRLSREMLDRWHWSRSQVAFIFAWGGTNDGVHVGRVGLGPPVGFFPLFKLEFSQQKKKFSAEITMSTLPKWVI